MSQTSFKEGEYVEAELLVDGHARNMIGVVKTVTASDDGEQLLQVDFGAEAKGEGLEGGVLQWKAASKLRRAPGNVSQPTTSAAASTSPSASNAAAADDETKAARSAKSTNNSESRASPTQNQAAPNSDQKNKGDRQPLPASANSDDGTSAPPKQTAVPSAATAALDPTIVDQAVWTLVAGPYAILTRRRPLLTILFLVLFTVAQSLYDGAAALPDSTKLGACPALTKAAVAAPILLEDVVRTGKLPIDLAVVNWASFDWRSLYAQLHKAVENAQRRAPPSLTTATTTATSEKPKSVVPSTTPESAKEENATTTSSKAEKKDKKKTKEADTAPTVVSASPAPSSATTVAANETSVTVNAALCQSTADFLQTICWLLIIAGTTAFTFANPRNQLAEAAKACKGMFYICSVVIGLFVVLKASPYVTRETFPADSAWATFVYDEVVRHFTVSTFTLQQLAVNSLLGLIGGIIGGVFSVLLAPFRRRR